MVKSDSTYFPTGEAQNLAVHTIVLEWAKRIPDAVAIAAPERVPLTYRRLNDHIRHTVDTLHAFGVHRNDRVAVVLPNGPDMAVAFLGVASAATLAPLNPQYQAKEFEFFLSDLTPKALIIQSGMDSPAIGVAKENEIAVIQLSPVREAGAFTLTGDKSNNPVTSAFAQSEDVALVLHTSGTTARPKLVPLTHHNICSSAVNIKKTLRLEASDVCLNIMPLFHIHGLICAVLSTVSAGASVVCTPGFYAAKFFGWMKNFRPTWYTAVPTMHQAILHHAKEPESREIIKDCNLRFIRSCSSALPPQVMTDLEKAFNAPVIESYGMTEAAHQIASNPLPPRKRKAGSVGLPSGPEVAIMDDVGNLLPRGRIGEIVIRGPNVTKGYENNPDANKKAFANSWFRTGDQGHFDEDDYLVIKDRIKEIINRGGEKISPREVDEVLLNHPSVAQAVTFAIPHPKLGEDVGAAVVLRNNATASEGEIQEFVASRLADFKVPRRILVLNEIPKGSTGKIQRIGLAEKLGLRASIDEERKAEYEAPKTPLEKKIAETWSLILGIDRIGVNDNFFQLGGDSIQARLILSHLREELHIEKIPLVIFIRAPTIRQMARIFSQKDFSLRPASLVAIQNTGSKQPFYCVHACDGEILFLADLARHLGPEQPFYALRAQGLDAKTAPGTRVEDMASCYVKEIQAIQPQDPYFLGGAGVGGIIALEMAQQLTSEAKRVGTLVLMDTVLPRPFQSGTYSSGPLDSFRCYVRRMTSHVERREAIKTAKESLRDRYRRLTHNIPGVPNYEVWAQTQKAANNYVPRAYPGRCVLLVPEKRGGFPVDPRARIDPWRKFATGQFDAHIVPGEHLGIFKEPNVRVLAQKLRPYLDEASAENAP